MRYMMMVYDNETRWTEPTPEEMAKLLEEFNAFHNEGYAATAGDRLIRRDLCAEAIRLARVLNMLLGENQSPEALGLLALMLLHDSRRKARVSGAGELVVLEEQDRSLWDSVMIAEGVAILEQALGMKQPGPYQIQAAISALHAEAAHPQDTDWRQITALYGVLYRMQPSPVVALNRAVAIAMAEGVESGLELLDPMANDLKDYMPYHAARADLLRRVGRVAEARAAYGRTLELTQNAVERAYFERRVRELGEG